MESTIATPADRRRFSVRKPQRVSFTLNYRTYQLLVQRSLTEGRSLSNLIAHLVERAIDAENQ